MALRYKNRHRPGSFKLTPKNLNPLFFFYQAFAQDAECYKPNFAPAHGFILHSSKRATQQYNGPRSVSLAQTWPSIQIRGHAKATVYLSFVADKVHHFMVNAVLAA